MKNQSERRERNLQKSPRKAPGDGHSSLAAPDGDGGKMIRLEKARKTMHAKYAKTLYNIERLAME